MNRIGIDDKRKKQMKTKIVKIKLNAVDFHKCISIYTDINC